MSRPDGPGRCWSSRQGQRTPSRRQPMPVDVPDGQHRPDPGRLHPTALPAEHRADRRDFFPGTVTLRRMRIVLRYSRAIRNFFRTGFGIAQTAWHRHSSRRGHLRDR